MQKGAVYRNGIKAGELTKDPTRTPDQLYCFTYDPVYLYDLDAKAVCIALPLRSEPYFSPYLFAFFSNILAEGNAKHIQCRMLGIDENDTFTRLLRTMGGDTIGSVHVEEVQP